MPGFHGGRKKASDLMGRVMNGCKPPFGYHEPNLCPQEEPKCSCLLSRLNLSLLKCLKHCHLSETVNTCFGVCFSFQLGIEPRALQVLSH